MSNRGNHMEAKHQVNQYSSVAAPRRYVYVINLANGTTPFIHFFDRNEYRSNFYRITASPVVVTHGHYRPTKEEFGRLNAEMQDYVLNGAMLCEPFDVALTRQMPNDPVEIGWDYEQVQAWNLATYGKRLAPMEGRIRWPSMEGRMR